MYFVKKTLKSVVVSRFFYIEFFKSLWYDRKSSFILYLDTVYIKSDARTKYSIS